MQEMSDINPNRLTSISFTRWLSYKAAVSSLLKNWDTLIIFFKNEKVTEKLKVDHVQFKVFIIS